MAAVSNPVRQPFGILNQSKLRSLESIKNRQNALPPSSGPSLKRRAPSPELSDSENIDPSFFEYGGKRKRASFEDDVSLAKQSRPRISTLHRATTTQKAASPVNTPRHEIPHKSASTPLSAPAAAGRSPTRLQGKYDKSQPRRRFVPPSLGTPSPALSIAAALRGTLSHKKCLRGRKPVQSLEDKRPESWFFDIHEESEDQQDYRMSEWAMTQSSAALDISDDEGKAKTAVNGEKTDRGKENIDPNEMFLSTPPVTRATTAGQTDKSDAMNTEAPRTPLSDLNAADYYAEGLNATSVLLVHDDVPQENTQASVSPISDAEGLQISALASAPATNDFIFEAAHASAAEDDGGEVAPEGIPDWAKSTSSQFKSEPGQEVDSAMPLPGAESAEIEIWESESAKDENEHQEDDSQSPVIVGEGQSISLTEGFLQVL